MFRRRSTWAALVCGALLALPAGVRAADEGYRVHPGAGKELRPLAAPTTRTTLDFRAPHGYVFTVEQAATEEMRAAGARPLYPEAGLWGVRAEDAPALRARLAARGLLLDASPDEVRRTRVLQADEASTEPLVPLQYMFGLVGTAGLVPPAAAEADGVLVIDSGLDVTHAEFAGRPNVVLENEQRVRGATEGEWHGTAVASTIGAAQNAVGMEGLYPTVRLGAWDGGSEGILTSETIKALRRAEIKRYRVVNMSFGGEGFTLPELLAVYRAYASGVLVVAAAGNENQEGNPDEYPALFPHVLTVAAVDETSQHAPFSNAKTANDLAAPGVRVVAAIPAAFDLLQQGLDCDETAQWCAVSGTSFAAPIASAAAAWVWAARPELDVTQVFDLLRFSARDVGKPGFDPATGFGVIDVATALTRKAPRRDPMEPNDEIGFTTGRLTGTPLPYLLAPRQAGAGIRARLDHTEDPLDVYKVYLRKGQRLRATVRPLDADVDLVVWPPGTGSVGLIAGTGRRADALARSVKTGLARDTVILTAPRTGTYFVDLRGNGRYDLVVQRLRG